MPLARTASGLLAFGLAFSVPVGGEELRDRPAMQGAAPGVQFTQTAAGVRAARSPVQLLIQASPLAGAQYHALDAVRAGLAVGDVLELVREPDNRYDRRAIRVDWQGVKLGYVPRRENRIIAAALDAGDRLTARVAALSDDPDPWRRLRFEVWIEP